MGNDILPYFPNYNPLCKRGEEIFFPPSYLYNAQERIFFPFGKMGRIFCRAPLPLRRNGEGYSSLLPLREDFSSPGKNVLPQGRIFFPREEYSEYSSP